MSIGPHPLFLYRKRLGLSIEAMAGKIGTTKATVSRIESRKRAPSPEMLQRIYDATAGEITPNDCLSMRPIRKAAKPKPKGLEVAA